ncbi:MAG: FAD synthetase [Bacteroidales bacterium]
MLVHESMDRLPAIPYPVVTIGSFDGVHMGHRTIINRLNQLAARAGGASVLVTFHPHPRKVLYPEGAGKELRLISSREEKCHLLEEAGLDHLIILPFHLEFARTDCRDFVVQYLVGKLHAHTVVVGFNHFFGHNKEGNFELLHRLGQEHGFQVEEIPEQEIQHETVSSTRIRKALMEGNIQRANAHLQHLYLVMAPLELRDGARRAVVRPFDGEKLLPAEGGYAVSVHAGGQTMKALAIVEDGSIHLHALPGSSFQNGPAMLRFHKHFPGTDGRDPRIALAFVDDLIY